jgi:hypothetical protein
LVPWNGYKVARPNVTEASLTTQVDRLLRRGNVRVGSTAVLTAPKRHFRSSPINGHKRTDPVGPVRAKPGNREKSNLPGKSCSIEAIQKVLHVFVANKNRIFATIHTCNKTWREAVEHRDFGLGTRYVASPSAACNH